MDIKEAFDNMIRTIEIRNVKCTPLAKKYKLDFSENYVFDQEIPEKKTVIIEHNDDPKLFAKNLAKFTMEYDVEKIVDKTVHKYEKEHNKYPTYRQIALWVRYTEEQKKALCLITGSVIEELAELEVPYEEIRKMHEIYER